MGANIRKVSLLKTKHRHHLVKAIKGSGRRQGNYVCECGKRFTLINTYEKHRADAKRIDKELESDLGLDRRAINPDYESAEEPYDEYFERIMNRDD